MLLIVCFALGADYYRSAAVLRTGKQALAAERESTAGNSETISQASLANSTGSLFGGGDTCGSAAVIGALPYNDSGTTVAFTDDYDLPVAFMAPTVTGCPTCNATGGGPAEAAPRGGVYLGTGTAADSVYSITFSSSDNSIDVTLTPTGSDDLALIVYTDVCSSSLADAIVVDDDGDAGAAEHVTISNMPAGTYNIVVDAYSAGGTPPGPSGPYTLAVTGTGVIAGGGPSISGTITYGNAISNPVPPRFVKNVSVASTAGSPAVGPVVTGTPGTYTLSGFGAGAYTIQPTKTGGPNGAITSNDAARVAQGVTGALPFVSQNQRFVADTTGNGAVSSQDAAKIAQFVAGLPTVPPNLSGQWKFFVTGAPSPLPTPPQVYNDSRSYGSVSGSATGEDYVGLLIGEASGNWNPATHPRGSESNAECRIQNAECGKPLTVGLDQIAVSTNNEIVVPVSVQGVADKEIISYEFDLRYDASVIVPLQNPVEVAGTVSRGLFAVANPYEPGLLRVVVYGPMPIDEDGVLLNLRFTAVAIEGSTSPLTFERIMFNDIDALDSVIHGEVKLSSASK